MKNKLLFLNIFMVILASHDLMGQVQLELDGDAVIQVLDTVNFASPIFELTIDDTKELKVKPSNYGEAIEGLQDVPYFSDFEDYEASYEKGHYYKHDDRVYLGGLIRKISGGPYLNNDTLFVLPDPYKPTFRVLAAGSQNGSMLRINIEVDGVVRVIGDANNSLDYLSLDCISFKQ